MNSSNPSLKSNQGLIINGAERWTVYNRLQELEISCQCSTYKPLRVHLSHPMAVIQLWSVLRQLRSPRSELVQWLDDCWHL